MRYKAGGYQALDDEMGQKFEWKGQRIELYV